MKFCGCSFVQYIVRFKTTSCWGILCQNVYPPEFTQASSIKLQTVPDFNIIFPEFNLTGIYAVLNDIFMVAWTITSSHVPYIHGSVCPYKFRLHLPYQLMSNYDSKYDWFLTRLLFRNFLFLRVFSYVSKRIDCEMSLVSNWRIHFVRPKGRNAFLINSLRILQFLKSLL